MSSVWKKLDTSSNSKFLKLDARTQIRFGSDPVIMGIHVEEDMVGNKKRVNCPGVGCPLCKAGKVPTKRYIAKVINRADGQAYILECGVMIMKEVKRYVFEPGFGDPITYDIVITKTGSEKQTQYEVLALPDKSAITERESQDLAELDISGYVKMNSIEDIKSMGFKAVPLEVIRHEPELVQDSDWDEL